MATFEITIDAQAPYALAHFWAEALPGYRVRPYDDAEITRLAAKGLTPETDTSVPIDAEDDAGSAPTIWFQKSTLGARVLKERKDHIVMLDPEGNQFCLFDPD